MLTGIFLELCDTPNSDGKTPSAKGTKRSELFNRLTENLLNLKITDLSREFLTLSILSCTTHIFTFRPRRFYFQDGFDSGSELEVFSKAKVLPREHYWMLKNGFELIGFEESRIHNIYVEEKIKTFKFGLSSLDILLGANILSNDANYFDVGKFYYKNDQGNFYVVYLPNKNSISGTKDVIDASIENVIRAAYETHIDMIEGKIPKSAKTEVLVVAPFLSQEVSYNSLTSFGDNYLPKVAKGADLGSGVWQEFRTGQRDKLSISDGHKFSAILQINEKLGYNERSDQNIFNQYKTDFSQVYSKSSDSFIKNLNDKLEHYWGIQHDSKGKKQYGLALQGSIRMYMDTGQKISVEKITPFLDSTEGLKDITLSKDNLYIDEACILGFKMDDNNNPIYRLFSVGKVEKGLPRDSEWQLGYPQLIYHNEDTGKNTYKIIPQVVITHDNGHILRGEHGLGETNYFVSKKGIYQLQDYGEDWCTPKENTGEDWYENNILEDYRGVKYGYKTIFYEMNRHGNYYKILGHELDLTSMKLKFSMDRSYNKDRFKDDSYEIKQKSEKHFLKSFSFLREFPISDATKKKTLELINSVLKPIYDLAKEQIEFQSSGGTETSIRSILSNGLLKILNSYIDENGVLHEGVGFEELRFLFNELITKDRLDTVLFNKFLTVVPNINSMTYNEELSDKDWFKSILDAFISYESPDEIKNPILEELDQKILKWRAKFFRGVKPRTFSDGPDLKEYQQGSEIFEDRVLAELINDAVIDTFGRYTYSKMETGSLFVDKRNLDIIHFAVLSWKSFSKSFRHNNRLFLQHYKFQKLGLPSLRKGDNSFGYVLDTIVFSPSRRLEIVKELGSSPEELVLNSPHIPTDNWNPSYIRYTEILQLGKDNLIKYTSELSYWLSTIFGYHPIVSQKVISASKSNIEGTHMFLKELFYKLKEKTKDYNEPNKEYYLHLAEHNLYHLLLLSTHTTQVKDRRNLIHFLSDPIEIRTHTITLRLLDDNVPDIFKYIELDQRDIQHWKENKNYETYLNSLRADLQPARKGDLDPHLLLSNLKEPISRFSISLKDLAMRYNSDNKKLYIIPMKPYTHGYAQHNSPSTRYVHTSDQVELTQTFKCWELDGARLSDFDSKYKYMLRSLLEGRYTLFIVSVDKITGAFENVGAFNPLQGSLSPNQIHFSSKEKYKTLDSIDTFDEEFSKDIDNIMKLFRLYSLVFIPQSTKDISELYDFPF